MAQAPDKTGERLAIDDLVDSKLGSPAELQDPDETPLDQGHEAEPPPQPPARREPRQEPAEQEEPEETPPAAAKDKTVEWQGEILTVDQFVERGHLDALRRTQDKYVELQEKHAAVLEREREQRAKPAETEQPKQLTQEEILREYLPEAKKAAQAGYLSSDFVESWPDEAAQMCFYRDLVEDSRLRLVRVENLMGQLIKQGTSQVWQQHMSRMFDVLAQREDQDLPKGFFEPLNHPQVRKEFLDYLVELGPRGDQLTGEKAQEFLARQYVAYSRDAYAKALSQQKQPGNGKPAQRTPAQARKAQAAGEQQGARTARPETETAPTQDRIALDDFVDSLLPPPE